MPKASLRLCLTVVAALGVLRAAAAQSREATPLERQFARLESRYDPPASKVQQAAYVESPQAQTAPTPGSYPTPVLPAPTVIPPANGPTLYPPPEGMADRVVTPSSDSWCIPPQQPGRTSSWTAAVELIPSQTYVTDGQFGPWDDNGTLALRLLLGYEDPEGLGVRARFWGLSREAETQADDIELNMFKFDVDLYKRIWLEHGDLAIGAGPSSGDVEFLLSDHTHSYFEGAGGVIFVDGYYTLVDFDRSELGAIVRARHSILLGDWRDTTGGLIVPRTNNDTMSVTELAWGLEYRRRFGSCDDHSWFLGLLAEYQRWQSDWLSNLAGTSIGVSGLDIYTGLNW